MSRRILPVRRTLRTQFVVNASDASIIGVSRRLRMGMRASAGQFEPKTYGPAANTAEYSGTCVARTGRNVARIGR